MSWRKVWESGNAWRTEASPLQTVAADAAAAYKTEVASNDLHFIFLILVFVGLLD